MKPTIELKGGGAVASKDGLCLTSQWRVTWKDKLRSKLFPAHHLDMPEAPPTHKDVLVCRVTCCLSMLDRIRVLISGRLMVETKTVTENVIGNHITGSLAYPLPIKALDREA